MENVPKRNSFIFLTLAAGNLLVALRKPSYHHSLVYTMTFDSMILLPGLAAGNSDP